MTMIKTFISAALLVMLIGFVSTECRADSFIVTQNTTPLIGSSAAPFSLNFQFNGTAGNTVTISNINLFGGALSSTPNVFGNVMVDGSGAVNMTTSASSFFNAFTAEFTPGTTLQFLLTITGNASSTPDLFSFAILDADGIELPTLGMANEFLSIDVTSPLTIQTFSGDSNSAGPVLEAPTIAASTTIPEPATMILLGTGLMLIAAKARRTIVSPSNDSTTSTSDEAQF